LNSKNPVILIYQ